jgi:hypothetical protein
MNVALDDIPTWAVESKRIARGSIILNRSDTPEPTLFKPERLATSPGANLKGRKRRTLILLRKRAAN